LDALASEMEVVVLAFYKTNNWSSKL